MNCQGSLRPPEKITVEPKLTPNRIHGLGGPPTGKTGKGFCKYCNREIALTRDGGALMRHNTMAWPRR